MSAAPAGGCPSWLMVGEVAGPRRAFGSAFRSISFPCFDPGAQVIAASVMAGLGIAALGLVVVPPCVTAWMALFTAGVVSSLLIGRHAIPFDHMLSIVFTLGVAIFGVLTVARWAFGQLKTNADVGCAERKRQPVASGI